MRCRECGASFEPRAVMQVFCSRKCAGRHGNREYREKTKVGERVFAGDGMTLNCANCGKSFTLMHYRDKAGRLREDKRTCFCSATCEKKYWRHPPQDDPRRYHVTDAGRSEWWEKMTNRRDSEA